MIGDVVFFGTPEFAVPTLEALCAAGRRPALVVSQPARPVGRGRQLRQPPVARRAEELALALAQPAKLAEVRQQIDELQPDLAVVVAYGKIFPAWLLALPRLGCVNLHASLLPRWRGAAPVQAAIAAGDRQTGVTTMRMEEGLDTGPTLLRQSTEIGAAETAPELAERLSRLGADLLVETLRRLEAGDLEAEPQPEEGVTYAPRIVKRDGRVDWALPAAVLYDRFRAFAGWPGLTAALAGAPLKLAGCHVAGPEGATAASPGTIVTVDRGALSVACGGGSLLDVTSVQRPGKREMPAVEFLRGERIAAGDRFDAAGEPDDA